MADTHFTPTRRTKSYADLVARFWSKVGPPDENGCRPWLAGKCRGYGHFGVKSEGIFRQVKAHAFAWRITYHGPTMPGREVFRHECDHPWCCEPTHITPGNHAENIADRDGRGRHKWIARHGPNVAIRGERHHHAKLTREKILAIRDALKRGVTQRQIAAEFGVRQQAISRIGSGKRWGWMDGTTVQSARRTSEKISAETVLAIRQRLAQGVLQREVAVEFGLTQQHVSRIASGKSWGWLKQPDETGEPPAPSETTRGRG